MVMSGPSLTLTLTRVSSTATREIHARADDAEALLDVVQQRAVGPRVQVGFIAQGVEAALETLRHGLNGREGIVELVAHDANQALPGLALFVAEGAAEVTEHHQVMGQTGLAKGAAAHAPAAGAAGESQLHGAHRLVFEGSAESQFSGGEAEEAFRGAREEAFAGTIDEAQFVFVVEGENGHVDFFHNGAQERGGFEGAEALLAQRLAEGIDFDHDFAHGVVAASAAPAHGEIFFAHGGEEIGKSLQGKRDAMAHGNCKAEPQADDEQAQSPHGAGGIVAGPQENHGDERARQTGRHGQEQNMTFVAEWLHSKPCFCRRRYIALRLRPSALAAWLTLPSWRASMRWMR